MMEELILVQANHTLQILVLALLLLITMMEPTHTHLEEEVAQSEVLEIKLLGLFIQMERQKEVKLQFLEVQIL